MEYENCCRACLRAVKRKSFALTDSIYEFLSKDLGMNSVPKEHPHLQLPQIVCSSCYSRIVEFHRFLQKCRDVETFLKLKLDSSQHNERDEGDEAINEEAVLQDEAIDYDDEDIDKAHFIVEILSSEYDEAAEKDNMPNAETQHENDDPDQYSKVKSSGGRNKNFKCAVCGKGFHCPAHLREHENIHSGIKPFCCDICGKCFTQKSTLVTHQYTLHYEKQVECEECGKKFARKSELKQHYRMHSDEKPFVCEVEGCKAEFRMHYSLLEHQAKHKGIRKFRCEICDHAFYTKLSLRRHKNKVHPKLSYQCDVCLSWFLIPSYIRKHMSLKHDILIEDVQHLKKVKT